jgi:outer membrane protein assembly factor BamB
MRRQTCLIVGLLAAMGSGGLAGDWPAFRGPLGTGLSNEQNAPVSWSREQNVKWKIALPGPGNSSPIVSGGRVFLSSATEEGRKRSLHCFDRADGRELWVRTVEFDTVMPTHKTNPHGASTPVSDGERVVVWHGSAGLHCYDFTGKRLWSRDLGEFRHIWGYAASPVLYKDRVILNCGPGERSFLAALDLSSGEVLWKTDEPGGKSGEGEQGGYIGSWSTPVIAEIDGQDQIVCSMPTRVNGYDPQSGQILWSCEGLANLPKGNLVYTSPVIADGICVAMGGYAGPAIGFKLGGSGDITDTHRLWRVERGNPQRIGSGVIVGDHLYMANAGSGGLVQCIEPKTGEVIWRDRFPGKAADHWGAIVVADGRLYVTNQDGTTHVFLPNPEKLEVVASNSLDEHCNATPAISNGEIFIRTHKHLYCIAEEK